MDPNLRALHSLNAETQYLIGETVPIWKFAAMIEAHLNIVFGFESLKILFIFIFSWITFVNRFIFSVLEDFITTRVNPGKLIHSFSVFQFSGCVMPDFWNTRLWMSFHGVSLPRTFPNKGERFLVQWTQRIRLNSSPDEIFAWREAIIVSTP